MPIQTQRLLVGGALLLHGLGHGGALGALIWIRQRPGTDTGDWQAARSWLAPALTAPTAMLVASAFWVLALLGFVAAALSFWGVLLPIAVWRPVAVAAALVSLAGIALFLGTWPAFNTAAAMAMNVAVLVALLGFGWPPRALFGN